MMLISAPALTGYGAVVTTLQILSTSLSFPSEVSSQTPYSKFAIGKKLTIPVPSRIGMLLIYTPAMVWTGYRALLQASNHGFLDRSLLLCLCLFLHFAKRVLETLFVHKYSGNTDATIAGFISLYYTFVSWIILHFQSLFVPSSLTPLAVKLGLVIFSVGEIGNLYHHCLLASLRKDKPTSYVVPKGGMFDLVATPHYFFELVAWLGIVLVAQQGNALLVLFSMASYLSGRSVATNKWNAANLTGYDKNKKNILPFLF